MRTFVFLITAALNLFCLTSCTFMKEGDATFVALGGKGAYRKGQGVVWNNEKSFRDGALAATAIATSGFSAATSSAQETTAQIANTNAATTAQKATAEAAAVEIVKDNNATKVRLAELPPDGP